MSVGNIEFIEGYKPEQAEAVSNPWEEIYRRLMNRQYIHGVARGVHTGEQGKTLLVDLGLGEDITGEVPADKAGLRGKQKLEHLLGRELLFKIERVDRAAGVVYLNRREALEEIYEKTWSELEEGQERTAVIRKIDPVRRLIYVDIGGVLAFLFMSEYGWGWMDSSGLKIGETFRVKVTKIDTKKKRVFVSRKALIPDPWLGVDRYKKGSVWAGTVRGVVETGVIVNLEPGIDVKTLHPVFRVRPGDQVQVKITMSNYEARRLKGRIIRIIKQAE
ncbi:hydroxymethylbutenyl pyrophosphate reductase [Thermincola ferriacetica]|uniref:Hydroxymethylbutenyl pyrophosphate reductase n=1 Tax=Thermincola ferriacetica TaxID=281456 RepID=A0A0L6W4E4_9FIRM|nr:S1 RNA-binding domain-containing protein [Thermincola ferriacetica]KNZ70346.1 hydroxymethylbutenyl pyrophosphate reductase [Thermincola ferriacetica]